MLEELIEACTGGSSKTVLLLADASFAELHRWTARPSSSEPPLPIYPLTTDTAEMHRILNTTLHTIRKASNSKMHSSLQLVMAVMHLNVEILTTMQFVLRYVSQQQGSNGEESLFDDCLIFTTTHPSSIVSNVELYRFVQEVGGRSGEDVFGSVAGYLRDCGEADSADPFPIRIFYTPCQSLPLLPISTIQKNEDEDAESEEALEIRIVASHKHRSLQPLTLSRLMRKHDFVRKAEYQSIYDVAAADLPPPVRQELKEFTADLAGILLHQLHIDPSNAIYAMGKTASLIGHHLLPCLDALKQTSQEGFNLSTNDAKIHHDSYAAASLIVIDRIEDLFTPATYASHPASSSPLAHRILNALKVPPPSKTSWVELDIPLTFPSFHAMENIWDIDPFNNSDSALLHPMAAVSNLSYQSLPSLRHGVHEGNDHLLPLYRALYLFSEEQCRQVLSDFFKGLLPPDKVAVLLGGKKKGFGVEILSYVQLLMEHCQRPGQQHAAHHYDKLLALTMAIIESLQRSNAKQFGSICSYQASIDTRSSRDNDLLAFLTATASSSDIEADDADMEVIASRVMKIFYSTPGSSSGGKESTGPIDVMHVLLQLIASLSLLRYHGLSTSFLAECSGHIARYLLSPKLNVDELHHLQGLGVLSSVHVQSIRQYRALFAESNHATETDVSGNAYFQLMQELVTMDVIKPLQDLCMMYNHAAIHGHQAAGIVGSSSVGEGQDDLRHKVWPSAYHLLNKTQTHTFDHLADHGLLSRLTLDCIACHEQFTDADMTTLPTLLEHIETPLQKMTRTGLDFLSKGLGRFGFGSSTTSTSTLPPHPGKEDVLVLVVVGGVTYREIAQLQRNLSFVEPRDGNRSGSKKFSVVLVSNNVINAEDVLATIFS